MRITLLVDSLQFLSLGTGKIHAVDRAYLAKYDYPAATMCGRAIPAGADIRPVRAMESGKVCGRCVAGLRTYMGGAKRLYVTPQVRFEESEAQR